MRKALAFIFTCLSLLNYSQDKKKAALFTIRGNVGIIRPVSSAMFATCFSGIYEANLSANLRLFSNFYVGLGYQSTYFQNTKIFKEQVFTSPTKNTSVPYNTNLIGDAGFIKLGFDRFFENRDKGYISYSVNTGIMTMRYTDVNADTSSANRPYGATHFIAPYIQPEVSANFIAEKHLSFSLMVSYTTLFTHFDPKAPRFNQFQNLIGKTSNRYMISYMNIAIGFTILLGK